jgi:hypothetical protein
MTKALETTPAAARGAASAAGASEADLYRLNRERHPDILTGTKVQLAKVQA